jgi:hypothetical protein
MPETGYLAPGGGSNYRVTAPGFTGGNVAHVHLDHRNIHTPDSIMNSIAIVCQSTGVEDEHIEVSTCIMDLIDEFPLMVRLEGNNPDTFRFPLLL